MSMLIDIYFYRARLLALFNSAKYALFGTDAGGKAKGRVEGGNTDGGRAKGRAV